MGLCETCSVQLPQLQIGCSLHLKHKWPIWSKAGTSPSLILIVIAIAIVILNNSSNKKSSIITVIILLQSQQTFAAHNSSSRTAGGCGSAMTTCSATCLEAARYSVTASKPNC